MRSKRIIGIAVIVITGVVILGLYIAYEWKQTIEIYRYGRNNYKKERTNEEYMAILTDNQEDFEYVARTMQQWSSGYIDFYENGRRIDFEDVSSNNPEIEDEIANNADFYNSLYNLYELDEIYDIVIEKDYVIMFYFSKFPQNYRGGVAYGEKERHFYTHTIDDNWTLQMIPNT